MMKEAEKIQRLADAAEVVLDEDYEKKDLKERRALVKNMLYDGSRKLKHTVPKGKRV